MSNSLTATRENHRHLFHCAAVMLALAAATAVTMPKLESAAVTTIDTGAPGVSTGAPEAAGCLQSWPYYERSCLRDGRQLDGNARTVRVIATGDSASRHASKR
jgi:hypothetical protein